MKFSKIVILFLFLIFISFNGISSIIKPEKPKKDLFSLNPNNNINNYFQKDKLLKKESSVRISGMGGAIFEASVFQKGFAAFLGGGAALTLNDFFIGAFGYTYVNSPTISSSDIIGFAEYAATQGADFKIFPDDRVKLIFNYGGIWGGYTHKVKPWLGFGASLKVGYGNVQYDDFDKNWYTGLDYTSCNIGIITPEFIIDMKLASVIKMHIGLGYRTVIGLDPDVYNVNEFYSPVISIGLFFGSFDDTSDVPEVDE